jgi:hypothetical protein
MSTNYKKDVKRKKTKEEVKKKKTRNDAELFNPRPAKTEPEQM